VVDLFSLFGPGNDRSYRRNRHNQNVSLPETHIFTSSVFNEARAGWNRSFTFEELETSFRDDISTQLGHCRPVAPHGQPPGMGPPNFGISQSSSVFGLPGLRTAAPWNPNGGQIWHFADNLSIVRGKHSFKTGGTIMRRNDVFIETLTARGSFNFGSAPGGAYTGNGLLDFLEGYIASASVGIAPLHGQPNQFWYAAYFQDDYKVTSSLTVNLGIRYDYFQPWKEIHDHWASFDLTGHQVVYAKDAKDAQGRRALKFGDENNFGLRFGFAWRPARPQELVVRGGYGIYYEQEHPSGPNAINPPPGGIGAADAPYSGFGLTRDFTAPALSTNPVPSLLWSNFSRGTASIPARVAVNAVDRTRPIRMCSSGTSQYRSESVTARSSLPMSRIRRTKSTPARTSTYRAISVRCTCSGPRR
jgi:hypothetical protein